MEAVEKGFWGAWLAEMVSLVLGDSSEGTAPEGLRMLVWPTLQEEVVELAQEAVT